MEKTTQPRIRHREHIRRIGDARVAYLADMDNLTTFLFCKSEPGQDSFSFCRPFSPQERKLVGPAIFGPTSEPIARPTLAAHCECSIRRFPYVNELYDAPPTNDLVAHFAVCELDPRRYNTASPSPDPAWRTFSHSNIPLAT